MANATPTLYYNAGQIATIVLDTESVDGYAIDPINPRVEGVIGPDLVSLAGFPVSLVRLGNEVGTFIARLQLPSTLNGLGTYLCLVKWVDPESSYLRHKTYTIIVGINFGAASAVGL